MSCKGVGIVWVHQNPKGIVHVSTGTATEMDDTTIQVTPGGDVHINNDAQYNNQPINIEIKREAIYVKQGRNIMTATPERFSVADGKTEAGFNRQGQFYRHALPLKLEYLPHHDKIKQLMNEDIKYKLVDMGIWREVNCDEYVVFPLTEKSRLPPVSRHWFTPCSNDLFFNSSLSSNISSHSGYDASLDATSGDGTWSCDDTT